MYLTAATGFLLLLLSPIGANPYQDTLWADEAPTHYLLTRADGVLEGLDVLNGQDGAAQYMVTGTAGVQFTISSASDIHTFNIPLATQVGVVQGLMSHSDWASDMAAVQLLITATSAAVPYTLVLRDSTGTVTANEVAATQFYGTLHGAARDNVLKTGDTMTGLLSIENSRLIFFEPTLAGTDTVALRVAGVTPTYTLVLPVDPPTLGTLNALAATPAGDLQQLFWVSVVTSATGGVSTNTPNTLVLRDSTGSFAAQNITLDGAPLSIAAAAMVKQFDAPRVRYIPIIWSDAVNDIATLGYFPTTPSTQFIASGGFRGSPESALQSASFGSSATMANSLSFGHLSRAGSAVIGYGAGGSLPVGAFIGTQAGASNNSGGTFPIICIGHQAGSLMTLIANNGDGSEPIVIGAEAVSQANTTSSFGYNVVVGYQALLRGSSNANNVCIGSQALATSRNASNCVAVGRESLRDLGTYGVTPDYNDHVALGYRSLAQLQTGQRNVTIGSSAMDLSLSVSATVGVGYQVMRATTGSQNTACGYQALSNQGAGSDNTALGWQALSSDTSGSSNTALGSQSMAAASAGAGNTGVGFNTLSNVVNGINLVALGAHAGSGLVTGTSNVYIGANLVVSTTTEYNTCRIANVGSSSVTGAAVLVSSSNQLGITVSSAEFKQNINDLTPEQAALIDYVTPRSYYRDNPAQREYGLIAEEVALLAPELVIYDEDGKPFSVTYEKLHALYIAKIQLLRQQFEEAQDRYQERLQHVQKLLQRVRALRKARTGQQ